MKNNMEVLESRLSSDEMSSTNEDHSDGSDGEDSHNVNRGGPKKSGMANVISRILSKDTSKSNRILLAKGKTNREIEEDIKRRRQKREATDTSKADEETEEKEVTWQENRLREEKRKLWENMGKKLAADMDVSRETKLRRIATQGMVQLFQSVHDHQKIMNQKIASVGPSERKKDKVMAEFTKGKFLDVLKSKNVAEENTKQDSQKDNSGKWKILQDDFMMGTQMKDWDKEDDDEDDDDNNYNNNSENEMSSSDENEMSD